MSHIVNRESLHTALQEVSASFAPGPLLLHIDLFRLGVFENWRDSDRMCVAFEDLLMCLFPERSLLIPTFNYDFCTTGLYDRRYSPSQVGVLTDYFRRRYPERRSLTPIFNFCVLGPHSLPLGASANCFGGKSLFADLVRQDGNIGFLGAAFHTNTFLHHVEESCDVSYRQIKRFLGRIVDGEDSREVTLDYRVRPLDSQWQYDWTRLENDLRQQGILSSCATPRGSCLFLSARQLHDYWSQAIRRQERFLLS